MQELNHNQLLEIKSMNKIKVFPTFISLNVLYKNLLALEDDMLSDDAKTFFSVIIIFLLFLFKSETKYVCNFHNAS